MCIKTNLKMNVLWILSYILFTFIKVFSFKRSELILLTDLTLFSGLQVSNEAGDARRNPCQS